MRSKKNSKKFSKFQNFLQKWFFPNNGYLFSLDMGYQKVAHFDDGHRDGARSVGNRGTEKVM